MTNSTKEMLAGLANKVSAAIEGVKTEAAEASLVSNKAVSNSSMSLSDITKLCLESPARKGDFDLTPNS